MLMLGAELGVGVARVGLGVLLAGVAFVATWLIQSRRLDTYRLRILLVVVIAAFLTELASDWPGGWWRPFWANHSIWADTVSAFLLLAVGLVGWSHSRELEEEQRAAGLSSIGMGGIVDHLVDVEWALSYLTVDPGNDALEWLQGKLHANGKPLGWLRNVRASVYDTRWVDDAKNRLPQEMRFDPRTLSPGQAPEASGGSQLHDHLWQRDIVDNAIRRLLTGMRNWTALIDTSQDGIEFLLLLSGIRADLMKLAADLAASDRTSDVASGQNDLYLGLLQRLRLLAYFAERQSLPRQRGPKPRWRWRSTVSVSEPWRGRPEVLTNWTGTNLTRATPAPPFSPKELQGFSRGWRDEFSACALALALALVPAPVPVPVPGDKVRQP